MDPNDCNKQYSLRWEKHAFNLASEAGCFFEDESFLDCTLSAEGQCIGAHKIILSASSSYLSNLLKIMPDKHPILIFNDIKFEQLKSLVAFIYNGSVNVSENNIHAFLNAAQSLLIKGLSEECKEEDKTVENLKRTSREVEIQDLKISNRRHNANPTITRKPEMHFDLGKNLEKQRSILSKTDGGPFMECEESLSKFKEISFTKCIHQNFKPIRTDGIENRRNGPCEEKPRENYIVKSWTHNSVEDLNGKLKQSKNNSVKKVKLEKLANPRTEDTEEVEKKVCSEKTEPPTGNNSEKSKVEEIEEKIKKEVDTEQIMLVEPKQELIMEEEDDTNSEELDHVHSATSDTIIPDSESLYDSRSAPNYYPTPVVDRGVPVPLLMCRTSLSEPESVEPNWMPQISGNSPHDHSPQMNSLDGNSQNLHCRTCAQELPCPTCTKKYKSRYALNRHILYECGKARKSFSCDECGRKVTRQDTLQKHKLIHLVQHLKEKETEKEMKVKKMRDHRNRKKVAEFC